MDINRVLIAMSGGVDSSVTAYLLKNLGYDCIGAMMKLYDDTNLPDGNIGGCCSFEDAKDARNVAASLDIPFYVFNFTDIFTDEVIDRFVSAYKCGKTPNPCIDCNRFVKFKKLINRACELECSHVATGHYARISREKDGGYLLKAGLDKSKDQSYVLYAMTQNQLAHTLLPLGEMTKARVRELALKLNLVNAKKQDSQDICFAPDGDYAGFIQRHTGKPSEKGMFISPDGTPLGEHRGLVNYTIGQRKGLGISASEPLYVCALSPENNTVTVGPKEALFTKFLTAVDINLIPVPKLTGALRIKAKIRYNQAAQPATVWQTGPDKLKIEFDNPQRAITPGQAVVMYDGDIVVGGGTII